VKNDVQYIILLICRIYKSLIKVEVKTCVKSVLQCNILLHFESL